LVGLSTIQSLIGFIALSATLMVIPGPSNILLAHGVGKVRRARF